MGNNKSKKYSENLDTLIALTTHLAMSEYKSRTPSAMSADLGLDYENVLHVLKAFTGIFRQSKKVSKKDIEPNGNSEHFYWLQLRYARWYLENKNEEDERLEPPLEAEYLVALLDFIVKMVEQEKAESRQYSTNIAALVASILALDCFYCGGYYFVWRLNN